ncbi:PEGA domain-containing protein [candidate division KSB1 bacterium]|nr:PEGA domain-containing protein [candidate division KSB1 bacterium]
MNRNRLVGFFFLLLIGCYSSNAYTLTGKIPIAILQLNAIGIDSTLAISLSDRLRSELLQTDAFDVMERERMEEILVEQGFQQTGACNNDECIVEAGRLLGISHMVTGSVGKVGSIFTITIRLIDVETGRILLTASEDIPAPIENVLSGIKTVAENLASRTASIDNAIMGYGSLRLESNPGAALIIIDDRALTATTPTIVDSVRAGVHVIRFQKGLLAASQAVFVAPNKETTVSLPLTMAKGSAKIVTNPAGATIFLDQAPIGKTPFELSQTAVGAYSLTIKLPGYVDYQKILTIQENETAVVSVQMTPQAYITIHSEPTGCEILLDDVQLGQSPIDSMGIAPGYHVLKISKPGFVPFETTRSFQTGKTTALQLALEPDARLVVQSTPSGATVFLNGEQKGTTPIELTGLREGPLNLRLQADSYQSHDEQVTLTKGRLAERHIRLNKRMGKLLVHSVPSEATVEIDGEHAGTTPLQLSTITFGDHLIRVTKSGYRDHEQRISITDELPQTINVKFTLARGTLFLHPTPKDATISLDGNVLEDIPENGLTLRPGEYFVKATRKGYEPYKQAVRVTASDGISLNIPMQPKTREHALIRSAIFPGWGQKYGEKTGRGNLLLIGEIVSLTGVLTTNIMYETKLNDFNEAQDTYKRAFNGADIENARKDMLSAHDDLVTLDDQRRTWTSAALAIWAIGLIDAAIFPPLRPEYVHNGYRVSMSLAF